MLLLVQMGFPPDVFPVLGHFVGCARGIATMAYGNCYDRIVPNDWLTPGQQVRRYQREGGYIPC